MKILIIIMLIAAEAMAMSTPYEANLLENYCTEYGGELVENLKCPNSILRMRKASCVYTNSAGDEQFFNGCSGPSGGNKEIFFKACIAHDLCYHNEPASNGKSQKDCDQDFKRMAFESCEQNASNIRQCKTWARIMYRSLRIIGKPSFLCSNTNTQY